MLKWFKELLSRKQIHRATHILNNIDLDAFKELVKVFCETEDRDLREYVGDHLLKNEKMDVQLKDSWILLKGIESDEQFVNLFNEKECGLNINNILNLNCDFKSNIAVAVFFTSYGKFLVDFIQGATLQWCKLTAVV